MSRKEELVWSVLLLLGIILFPSHGFSTNLPDFKDTSDTSVILKQYPAYLKYVLEVGRHVDAAKTKELASIYDRLAKKSPDGAARFLRGLRFEISYKVDLMANPPASITSSNPEMRKWVGKYLSAWIREADEAHFRSVARR